MITYSIRTKIRNAVFSHDVEINRADAVQTFKKRIDEKLKIFGDRIDSDDRAEIWKTADYANQYTVSEVSIDIGIWQVEFKQDEND